MIAIDTNLLVYSHRPEMPRHDRAREILAALAGGTARWAIPWPCVHEFYAIVTNTRIFRTPATPTQAIAFLEALAGSESLRLIGEGLGHLKRLGDLAKSADVTGRGIHDARIAALCLEHGVRELWTADRDFSRFPSLKVANPLVDPSGL